jgi:fluoroacetyl-CoA thioesterase
MSGVKEGLTGRASSVVQKSDLASSYGNPGVDVMSSMTLMTLLEQASIAAIAPHLGPDDMTVGAHMSMDHLAPTPEGFTVTAEAVVAEVKGPKMVFKVTAFDGADKIAEATHIRFLVDKNRFLEQVAAKAAKGAS